MHAKATQISSIILIVFLSTTVIYGQSFFTYWQSPEGNWSDVNNWDNGEPTTGGGYTYVINGGTVHITEPNEGVHELYIGNNSKIEMSSGNLVTGDRIIVASTGAGTFIQTGGTSSIRQMLYVGSSPDGKGVYQLSGGNLSVYKEQIGSGGEGEFIHTAGSHSLTSDLTIGYNAHGVYRLSGTGTINMNKVYIGKQAIGEFYQNSGTSNITELSLGQTQSGTYTQSGGQNTVKYMTIQNTGTYKYSGGTLHIDNGLNLKGNFDLDNQDVTVSCGNAIINLADGNVLNAGAGTLEVGQNSLTIYSAGHHPSTLFGTFYTQGLIHEKGTTLIVNSGQGFAGTGIIDDPVDCSGTITAAIGQSININNHIIVRQNGNVNLGEATFKEDNGTSKVLSGSFSVANEIIADRGTGSFIQDGGTHRVEENFRLAANSNSHGSYELNAGTFSVMNEFIAGYRGTGIFTQNGGTHNVSYEMKLGISSYAEATYNLNSGELSSYAEYIGYGYHSIGTFNQNGGINNASWLTVGSEYGSNGTYNLFDGDLTVNNREYIGRNGGTGELPQSGGTNRTGILYIGFTSTSHGTYTLSGSGGLEANNAYIGYRGTGTFNQQGGTNEVNDLLYIGYWSGSNGTYTISGGELIAENLYVGKEGNATFSIENAITNITVSKLLSFGPNAIFNAVEGSVIHMTGSNLENASTNPTNLAGMENLTLIFEGGATDIDLFEVAGEDMGLVDPDGWTSNFALDTLIIGGNDIGQVRLADNFDNQPNWNGSEALYVDTLILGAGSLLDLNGLNLYYRSASIDPSAVILYNGGMLIPEPTSISLMLCIIAAFIHKRNKA